MKQAPVPFAPAFRNQLLAPITEGAILSAHSLPLPDKMPPEIQIHFEIDIERLRIRLRGMTDEQLRQFGKAARYMVSPSANLGKPPLPAFAIQLDEAKFCQHRDLRGSGRSQVIGAA